MKRSRSRIFDPHPEYLPAMKCLAMRLGEEIPDRDDVALRLKMLGFDQLSSRDDNSLKSST
jgi:hypothetical protein